MSWFYMLLEITLMVGIDLLFLAALVLMVVPLGMFRQTAFAVLKRNFVGYFSNPTGYVFLCLFVCFTSGFAFWPPEFFASNLANFDQLNKYLPIIMLVYVPAITMSIWSEEKRQGTDELLLTLPTTDIDIVLGKYFAAVFVFTVALLYSQLCNYIVLVLLTNADLDVGLLATNYLGYWFVGLAMLAIGMVASFVTNNLTVAFVFGVLFNAPLALFSFADTIVGRGETAMTMREWSLLAMFETFGRGLIGLGPVFYFVAIVAFGLYLCMVLIGRRHWHSGRKDGWMWLHYIVRAWTLLAILVGTVVIIENSPLRRVRVDLSESKVSTLSRETKAILRDLADRKVENAEGEDKSVIIIDAFIADEVPTEYVQTRYELINLLQEFDVLGGDRIKVNLHTGMKPYSEEAVVAEERFDIRPVPVATRVQGRTTTEEIIMGASFASGLERVTVPFFEYGMPVEYELIRSINTVAKSERKTVGILATGAVLGLAPQEDGSGRQDSTSFLAELKKQYNVEILNPNSPITVWEPDPENEGEEKLRYDVLLVPQPSMLSAQGMSHLLAALKKGQPSALFEDPLSSTNMALNTSQPRQQYELRGDIQQLWQLLQIEVYGQKDFRSVFQPDIVWQDYNPYQQVSFYTRNPEVVFVRTDLPGSDEPFNVDSEITTGLEEVVLPHPGAIKPTKMAEELDLFTSLVQTGKAGVIRYDKLTGTDLRDPNAPQRSIASLRGNPVGRYILCGHIKGEVPSNMLPNAPGVSTTDEKANLNVIYVADLDLLNWIWVGLRNQPNQGDVSYRIQNLTFGLNIIDVLAGDLDYVSIRNRARTHKTLKAMEEEIDLARGEVFEERQNFEKEFDDAVEQARAEKEKAVRPYREITEAMEKAMQVGQPVDRQAYAARKLLEQSVTEKQDEKLNARVKELQRERDEKLRQIERRTDLAIVRKQNEIKFNALWIPVVPPLLLSLIVFTMRRLRERAGIAKTRLR